MLRVALLLILLLASAAGVEAVPIDFSASVGGISIDGTSEDAVLAPDCAPGAKCSASVKREIELKLPKEPRTLPAEPTKVIVIPALPHELKPGIEEVLKLHSPDEARLLFEFLKEGLLKGNLDDFTEEFTKPHFEVGVKKPRAGAPEAGELTDYESLLEELIEGFRYKGEASFAPGEKPLGAALIVFNPVTEEGAAAVTLFAVSAVPAPASLLLLGLGLVGLAWRRRTSR